MPPNMAAIAPHASMPQMPFLAPMVSGAPWGSPWQHQMPYMLPSLPLMSPLMPDVVLHDSMEFMKHNINMFHRKASMLGMLPLPSEDSLLDEERPPHRRSAPVRNGLKKERRKSLPSEHELHPGFHTEAYFGAPGDLTWIDFTSKSAADEGYASYQKTNKDSSSLRAKTAVATGSPNKLENYTASPPMRRKSLPDPRDIVSVASGSGVASGTAASRYESVNRSVPAIQTDGGGEYGDARTAGGRGRASLMMRHRFSELDASLYSIDASSEEDGEGREEEEDNASFVSSLEGKYVGEISRRASFTPNASKVASLYEKSRCLLVR